MNSKNIVRLERTEEIKWVDLTSDNKVLILAEMGKRQAKIRISYRLPSLNGDFITESHKVVIQEDNGYVRAEILSGFGGICEYELFANETAWEFRHNPRTQVSGVRVATMDGPDEFEEDFAFP